MKKPIKAPQRMPVSTAIGNDVAGRPKLTPPMKMTASRPSRSTVMNGNMNMAYFSNHRLKRLPAVPTLVLSLDSSALASLTRHLSWSLDTRRRAAPISVMTRDAKRPKDPSQMSSVPAQ